MDATTTLFARRMEEEGISISPIQATLFLAGIYEDTGNMTFPVFTVSDDTPMGEAARMLRDKGCTGLPVVRGDKLVGVISRSDFKKFRNNSKKDPPVKAFMSTEILTIGPGDSVVQAVRIMVRKDIGRLPVLKDGKLIGIVTRSDTMRYYYDLLPD